MGDCSFKSKLKDVLSNAVSYFQDTGDPNGACIKAAEEAGFTEDQVDRLVETFNTARVLCHYKAADDKGSPCSLADKSVVRRGIPVVPEVVKESEYSTDDYDFYRHEETDYVVPTVKMAAFVVTEAPLSKEASDFLSVRAVDRIADLVKSAEEEARAANALADELATKVAERVSLSPSIDAVRDRVARIAVVCAGDDRYAAGVEKMAAVLPSESEPSSALLDRYSSAHVIDTDDIGDALVRIKEASDFAAEAAALTAYADAMMKYAKEELPDDMDQLKLIKMKDDILRGRKGGGSSEGGKRESVSLADTVKPFSFLASMVGTGKQEFDEEQRRRSERASDEVDNLRRQLILQDLLVRDKVLSQEPRNSVIAAYRSINQVSPDTALNKEILRSMLRNVVQSVALSPYDAKTLADVDKSRGQAYSMKDTKNDTRERGK